MNGGHTITLDTGGMVPGYVKELPFVVRVGWLKVFNLGLDQYGEVRALQMANLWALRKLDELKNQPEEPDYADEVIEAITEHKLARQEMVSVTMSSDETTAVSMSNDGQIILEAVLADNSFSTDGKRFTDDALISMAEQINTKGLALPDIEHEEYNSLMESCANVDQFKQQLMKKKGLFTKIKAFYNDGKLMVKAWLDRRYKNHVDIYRNLSIEAYSPLDKQEGDTYLWAEPLSFTFTNKPKLVNAEILSVS